MARLLLLNGPNLNLLGSREPALYGTQTLAGITDELRAAAQEMGHELLAFQSNHEGALIDRVHAAAADGTALAIVNPGGLTHTSVALRDAFLGTGLGFVEVHLSNLHAREDYRQRSYFSDIARGVIVGFGATGYSLALLAANDLLLLAGAGAATPAPVAAPGPARARTRAWAADDASGREPGPAAGFPVGSPADDPEPEAGANPADDMDGPVNGTA